MPDYVVVEGPLAGGHLGFGMDWAAYDLATIVAEIRQYLAQEQLDIPLIPAGGIFTGGDAVRYLEAGAAAVQVATRFTVTRECGLPDEIKQEYFKADEGRHRGQPDLAHRLSDAHDQVQPRHRRRHPAPTARPTATCSTPTASAPTSRPGTAKWLPTPGPSESR